MKFWTILILGNLCILCGLLTANAQVKVSLKIDESIKSFNAYSLFCDKEYKCGLAQNEQENLNDPKLVALMKVSRSGEDFSLLVDANLNNKLTDEKAIVLKKESSIIVKIKTKLSNGKFFALPYEISHLKVEKNDLTTDYFQVVQHYVSAGKIKYKNCSSNVGFSDMNFDGAFNLEDADRGTNFTLDKNNDGKFWGKNEYYKTSEIIEFCGQNFLVSALNFSQVVLTPTDLKLAKIGESVPAFSFELINGEKVSSEKLSGKIYILDFWASWCVICVENLPEINSLKKEFRNEVLIYSINVDELSQKAVANKIINEKGLSDFTSIRGLGENDKLWKTFGGANLNKLSIPLYVLVDQNGVVKYADKGGENLVELKKNIKDITKTGK